MAKAPKFIPCRIAQLDAIDDVDPLEAARIAVSVNPINAPRIDDRKGVDMSPMLDPARIAVLTTKYWGAAGLKLSVSFQETTAPELRDKIIAYMNKWSTYCNVTFAWSQSGGDVRISRGPGGYWSYLGTDIRSVAAHRQTMNLEGFTLKTSESEYERVVTHETGHTLGCPHEHLRPELVDMLDEAKTIAYFKKYQGWDEGTTRSNVLTPISERSLTGASPTDPTSIMCYQLPGQITKDGKPIPGGNRINPVDGLFMNKLYPKAINPTDPTPPPTPAGSQVVIDVEKKVVYGPAGWTFQTR